VTFGDDGNYDGNYDNLNYYGGSSGGAMGGEVAANNNNNDDVVVIGRQKGVDVIKEMTEICMEFDDECHPIENLAIELNSFKFSQNATYSDCATACLLSLLRKMQVSPAMSDGRLVSLLKIKLDTFWTGMLQKLCPGVAEELSIVKALEYAATIDQQQEQQQQQQSPTTTSTTTNNNNDDEQAATTEQTEIAQKLRSGMAFRFVLQTLHDQEVLSEESILMWAEEHRRSGRDNNDNDNDDPKRKLFMIQSVQDFLEWLEEEDSDEEESGSDDDDSE